MGRTTTRPIFTEEYLRSKGFNIPPRANAPTADAAIARKVLQQQQAERLIGALMEQLRRTGLMQHFIREYRFHETRRFALDLYCHELKLGIEVHGGVNGLQGRHIRPEGFKRDRVKMNLAKECEIDVYEYTADAIASGDALAQIERVMNKKRAERKGVPDGSGLRAGAVG